MADEFGSHFGEEPTVGAGRHGNKRGMDAFHDDYRDPMSSSGRNPGGDWGLGISIPRADLGMEDLEQALKDARARANGQVPTLAENQLKQGQENALRGAVALAGMGRGGGIGAQQMQAANVGAGTLASTNEAAAQMRIQEQQIAEQQAAALAQAIQQANFQQSALGAQNQLALNSQNIDWLLGKGNLELGRKAEDRMKTDQMLGLIKTGIGAIGSAVGGALGSDERMKHDMRREPEGEASRLVAELPENITFDYNDNIPEQPGRKFGYSAQELEKTSLGPQLIMNTPGGKMIDTRNAGVLALAAAAENSRELQRMRHAHAIDPFENEQVSQAPRGYVGRTAINGSGEVPEPMSDEYEFGSPEEIRDARNQRIARTSERADPFAGEGDAVALAARDAARYAVAEDRNRMRRVYAIDPFA